VTLTNENTEGDADIKWKTDMRKLFDLKEREEGRRNIVMKRRTIGGKEIPESGKKFDG
jgi:hypothetical protein